jgi:xanthine dehydrogenase YagS FAD-binding subunit
MNSITYDRAPDLNAALAGLTRPGTKLIGGGTNLLDLMKQGVETPVHLIDINHIAGMAGVSATPEGGLRIGALTSNTDCAGDPLVRQRYPLLSQALLAGASQQLRNMATVGGNLMQRTRCGYFYDTAFAQCNKRAPGTGCAAREGHNRMHAILGASEHCIAVNPSDMNVALAALDAVVVVAGPRGQRRIPVVDFHRLPGDRPELDTVLAGDEMILAVDLPPSPYARHAHYLKIRDRQSYAFALVSVACALEMDGATVRSARIALGGVAHKPWRVSAAEQALAGRALDDAALGAASQAALQGAQGYKENGFKIKLAQRAIVRAARTAGGIA